MATNLDWNRQIFIFEWIETLKKMKKKLKNGAKYYESVLE